MLFNGQPFPLIIAPSHGDTIRYDTIDYKLLTCAQKRTSSQHNLPHWTEQKRIIKKLKPKTEMLRRNGPVVKSVKSVLGWNWIYGGKDLWKRYRSMSRKRCKIRGMLVLITNRKWAFIWFENRWPWMTLNSVIAVIGPYFALFYQIR